MPAGVLWVQERDAYTDFGFEPKHPGGFKGFPGLLGSAPRGIGLITAPEMPGGMIDANLIQLGPGKARLEGFLEAASQSAAQTKLDALKAMFRKGEVRVRSIYAPDRYCFCVREGLEAEHNLGPLVEGKYTVSIDVTVKDGVAYRSAIEQYALSGTAVAIACGTAKTRRVWIKLRGNGGTLTDPNILVLNSAGDTVQTMSFSTASLSGGVLGANDDILVNTWEGQITKSLAGTKTDAAALCTALNFPKIDPEDGWPEEGIYPQVKLTASAGTPVGVLYCERAFE